MDSGLVNGFATSVTGIRRRTLHSSGLGYVEDFNAPGDHPAPCVALDKNYIKLSATKQWRTTPLKGIWVHPQFSARQVRVFGKEWPSHSQPGENP